MAWIVGPTRWNLYERDQYIGAICLNCPLGTTLSDGSSLICKNGNGVAFFVAPSASEVSRNWYSTNDAVTTAQSLTGCTGWFVPSCSQLITGYACRSFWNSFRADCYWSNQSVSIADAWSVCLASGFADNRTKTNMFYVRAFRCVTY